MIGIISVTEKGDSLAVKINNSLGGELLLKSKINDFKLDKVTKEAFEQFDSIVFISSTGIAVRAIAKYLNSKDKDPAVVVVDVCNNFSISLVSGHLGGANNLTLKVAEILNNTPVITTATDNMNIVAPDIIAMNNNLIIDDLKIAKVIASRLVNGEEVYFKDDKRIIECPKGYVEINNIKENVLWITNKLRIEYKNVLKLIRKDIVLGIGCRRNTDSKEMYDFVTRILKEKNIDIRSVSLIASIDIKSDEKAILELREKLNCEIRFFTADEIKNIEHKYKGSDFVKKITGVSCVSEPVIELCKGKIIFEKVKSNGMTLTIGERKN